MTGDEKRCVIMSMSVVDTLRDVAPSNEPTTGQAGAMRCVALCGSRPRGRLRLAPYCRRGRISYDAPTVRHFEQHVYGPAVQARPAPFGMRTRRPRIRTVGLNRTGQHGGSSTSRDLGVRSVRRAHTRVPLCVDRNSRTGRDAVAPRNPVVRTSRGTA
jgi:hypothetical protein